MTREQIERDLDNYMRALREALEDLIDAQRRAEAMPFVVSAIRGTIASLKGQLAILDEAPVR